MVRYANRVFGVVFKLGNNQRRQLGIYTSFPHIFNSPPPEFYFFLHCILMILYRARQERRIQAKVLRWGIIGSRTAHAHQTKYRMMNKISNKTFILKITRKLNQLLLPQHRMTPNECSSSPFLEKYVTMNAIVFLVVVVVVFSSS